MPYGSKLSITPPTNYHLPAAEQEPYKKGLSLSEKCLKCSGKKCQQNRPLGEEWQDGKSKRTRKKHKTGDRMERGLE